MTAEVILNPSLDSISFGNLDKSKSASLPWKVFKSTSFISMRTPTFYNTEVNRIVDISQIPSPAMLDQQFPRPQVTYWSTGAATIPTTMTIGQGQARFDKMSVKHRHIVGGGEGKLCATCCIFRWPTSLGQEPTQSVDKEYLSCFTRKLSSSVTYWLASRF